jgi:hypothetical protein
MVFHRLIWPSSKPELMWAFFLNNITNCLCISCAVLWFYLIKQVNIVIFEEVQYGYMHDIKYKVTQHVKSL